MAMLIVSLGEIRAFERLATDVSDLFGLKVPDPISDILDNTIISIISIQGPKHSSPVKDPLAADLAVGLGVCFASGHASAFIQNMKMSDAKASGGVRCSDPSWKRLRAGYSLLKLVLFGVLFLSCLDAVAPSTAQAATYVRVYYGGRPYRGYPYVYRGRYYYHGNYWHRRYYRYGRWHYY
jgi:hypothetical protein